MSGDETISTALGRDDTMAVEFDGRQICIDCKPGVAAPNYYTDAVLDALATWQQAPGAVLDVGTGTGVLAIAAALRWPEAHVVGFDIDPAAVRLARHNVDRNGLHATRCEMSVATAVAYRSDRRFDLIIANPPQIPVPPGDTSLGGAGPDGTQVAIETVKLAGRVLSPKGVLLIGLADFVRSGPIAESARRASLRLSVRGEVVQQAGPFTTAHKSWIERRGYRFAEGRETLEFRLRLLEGHRHPKPGGEGPASSGFG